MDVVAHYSPPTTKTSPVHATSFLPPRASSCVQHDAEQAESSTRDECNRVDHTPRGLCEKSKTKDQPRLATTTTAAAASAWPHRLAPTNSNALTTTTGSFNRSVQISVMEPVGSMSLSPANREVVLAARKGLFIIDLENPYEKPRFLPHLTTWVPADVQWNPHPARAKWIASTSNNKLLVWNLDRAEAARIDPTLSASAAASNAGTSPSLAASLGLGSMSPLGVQTTLPFPLHASLQTNAAGTISRLSCISHVLNAHTRAITDIDWSPFHPDILASCGIDSWTWAWDMRDPNRPKQGYSAWNAAMTQVKWNHATQHRLATSCDNKVLIWDDRKGALPLATVEAHENRIYGVDWSRDASLGLSRLVTCSLDGTVKWWDLNSLAAQQAIGQRQLVTEPELIIQTDTPVWRARHLPFGQGVMTLPQRGDTSLSMWSKDNVNEPVHRFNGHHDIVKEYLIRKSGGESLSCDDDRHFQLITWSKDQTLRLWPITDEMTKAVGHRHDSAVHAQEGAASNVPASLDEQVNGDEETADRHSLPASIVTSMLPRSQDDEQCATISEINADDAHALAECTGYQIRQYDSDLDSQSADDYGSEDGENLFDAAGSTQRAAEEDTVHPPVEQILDTLLWVIPFATLYLIMDVMIQQQYAMHPTVWRQAERMASAIPLLAVFIYYTAIRAHGNRTAMQMALCALATVCGCAFLYTYARSSQMIVTRRTAPLGTLWIYAIARLDLKFAIPSLAVVYGFVAHHNLDVFD